MLPKFFLDYAVRPALELLPDTMRSREAQALLVAIALQESKLQARRQYGSGPARGYTQFEKNGGVRGVLAHPVLHVYIQQVLAALDYTPAADATFCWTVIEHNDVLLAAFSRLLLWPSPKPLPQRNEVQAAWDYYIDCWRPGKPHRNTWDFNYARAWATVEDI